MKDNFYGFAYQEFVNPSQYWVLSNGRRMYGRLMTICRPSPLERWGEKHRARKEKSRKDMLKDYLNTLKGYWRLWTLISFL